MIADAKRKQPSLAIEPRAIDVFNAYLRVYSFSVNVAGEATTALRRRDINGAFKWHEKELQLLHKTTSLPPIGVPQGGALSCLIANAVLHKADKELNRLKGESERVLDTFAIVTT